MKFLVKYRFLGSEQVAFTISSSTGYNHSFDAFEGTNICLIDEFEEFQKEAPNFIFQEVDKHRRRY